MKLLLLFATAFIMAGCSVGNDGDQQAQNAAEAWADAYFNCDFKDACNYVTPESQKWLQFAASNTTEQDLKLLQEAGGAWVTSSDRFDEANDTMRLVTLTVTNCLTVQGQTSALTKKGTFKVVVVRREAGWLVKMAGLPQSGMRSHD